MKIIKFLPLFLGLSCQAQGVSKSAWIEGMSTNLPVVFCQSEQYFRQCYRVSVQKCEEVAASTTRICLNKFSSQMPAMFKQRQQGENWGRIIGQCAGEAYDKVLRKEFINTSKCNDPKAWVN